MIQVLLIGHNRKHELTELIKVFFPKCEIEYIENKEEYLGKGILIVNELFTSNEELNALTKVYTDNILVEESIENINLIEIYRESLNKDISIGIKKSLYNTLINISKTEIPWGILTGIRPIKIIHDLLDKNIDEDTIIKLLTKEYKLNIKKAKLALDIGKRQRRHIYLLDEDRYSLYVSIPFCPTRCLYCSFPALAIDRYRDYVKEYTLKLIDEIKSIKNMMEGKRINTVYIGGGTPTAIPSVELEKIIQSIYNEFGEKNIREFTVEAGRPDTITKEYLQMLNKNNINRISINPQTMNDNTLKIIGRHHNSYDIIKTFNLAKEIGFDVINMDLIIGLPGEGIKEIKHTLQEVEKLNPENLTIHTLSVKRGSRFKETMDKYSIQSQYVVGEMLNETIETSKKIGLVPYYLYRQKQILGNFENIGYCKPQMDCIYNIAMMEERETIMAAGMGSVSKIYFPEEKRIERVPNFKDLKEYLERNDELIQNKRKILEDHK